jgi:hypothetical protein
VNDVATGEDDNPGGVSHESRHYPVFGGGSTSCTADDSTVYNGGYVLESTPIPGFTYRVFQFKTETERQLALADSRNQGLQYAKKMTSTNGCDVEVIYEFKPKPGGGLKVEVSAMGVEPYEEGTPEGDAAHIKISNTLQAWVDPVKMELIMTFDNKVIRETQGLPYRESCGDERNFTAMRFAAQFICKNTGERVNITSLQFSRPFPVANDCPDMSGTSPGVCNKWTEISWDPNNPTRWNPNENPFPVHKYMSDWYLIIDPANAPESCGSFYWDPLFATPDGDSENVRKGQPNTHFGWEMIAGIVVGVVVIGGLAGWLFLTKRRKATADVQP